MNVIRPGFAKRAKKRLAAKCCRAVCAIAAIYQHTVTRHKGLDNLVDHGHDLLEGDVIVREPCAIDHCQLLDVHALCAAWLAGCRRQIRDLVLAQKLQVRRCSFAAQPQFPTTTRRECRDVEDKAHRVPGRHDWWSCFGFNQVVG